MQTDLLQFHCAFTEPATLPPFKGSTLRGAFGHALRRICCALRRGDCHDCLLLSSCCYSQVFESERLDKNSAAFPVRLAAKPHPYVLRPPATEEREFAAGERFSFEILLFGDAIRYRPQIVYAVTTMGETGLGKQDGGRFTVTLVTAAGRTVFDGERRALAMEDTSQPLRFGASEPGIRRLRLHLLTPLRLKSDNQFARELPFAVVARAAMRRVAALENHHGDGEPAVDYRQLARQAEEVEIIEDRTSWKEISRYSNRQKCAMQMGGLVGSILYQGDLAPFLPFLRYCEVAHLGKQTTFGHGRIRLEADPA